MPVATKLENSHTTGAEQQKNRVTPAAMRTIGHLSATTEICVMILPHCESNAEPHFICGRNCDEGSTARAVARNLPMLRLL
jgi:hypothetical protein